MSEPVSVSRDELSSLRRIAREARVLVDVWDAHRAGQTPSAASSDASPMPGSPTRADELRARAALVNAVRGGRAR